MHCVHPFRPTFFIPSGAYGGDGRLCCMVPVEMETDLVGPRRMGKSSWDYRKNTAPFEFYGTSEAVIFSSIGTTPCVKRRPTYGLL